MSNRTAITRHTRRANPAGIPAERLIQRTADRLPAAVEHPLPTRPILIPGLRPALPTGATR